VADSAISIGFVLLVVALWREERRDRQHDERRRR
jgi:lipoprotein signal peptidase